jgi:hypothetical protein
MAAGASVFNIPDPDLSRVTPSVLRELGIKKEGETVEQVPGESRSALNAEIVKYRLPSLCRSKTAVSKVSSIACSAWRSPDGRTAAAPTLQATCEKSKFDCHRLLSRPMGNGRSTSISLKNPVFRRAREA